MNIVKDLFVLIPLANLLSGTWDGDMNIAPTLSNNRITKWQNALDVTFRKLLLGGIGSFSTSSEATEESGSLSKYLSGAIVWGDSCFNEGCSVYRPRQ